VEGGAPATPFVVYPDSSGLVSGWFEVPEWETTGKLRVALDELLWGCRAKIDNPEGGCSSLPN